MTTEDKGKVLFTIRRPKNILASVVFAAKMVLKVMIVAVILITILSFTNRPYDDTDWPELEQRSGMRLYIDHGTGCHWIKVGYFGNLLPRMNSNARQVCLIRDFRPPKSPTKPESSKTSS